VPAAARKTTTTDAQAARAWLHAQQALVCDALEEWEFGTVGRTPTAPGYWDANFVRVERDPGPDADALIAAADALQSGLTHRKLEVEDEAAGLRLRAAFDDAGWYTERLAYMRRQGAPPPGVPEVREVPFSETRPLRVEWYVEDGRSEAEMVAVALDQERLGPRRDLRAFMLAELGFVSMIVGVDAVEIDQLYVTPWRRGYGIGPRLVASALAAAGREDAWIVADDEDRPRLIYERLGFRTVWKPHAFIRVPEH
jgi:predicted GNAT family acetyltransferase